MYVGRELSPELRRKTVTQAILMVAMTYRHKLTIYRAYIIIHNKYSRTFLYILIFSQYFKMFSRYT